MKCPNDQCHYFSNVNSDCCYTCGAMDINLTSSPDEQETETRKEKWEMSASQREMKFRVWDKKRKVMISWNSILKANPSLQDMLSEEYTWLQFTGLLDKNNIEIYEGEILLVPDEYTDRILDDGGGPREPCNHLAPVVFKAGSFGVEIFESADNYKKGFWSFERMEDSIGDKVSDLEIIGDIYLNPELLKEAK